MSSSANEEPLINFDDTGKLNAGLVFAFFLGFSVLAETILLLCCLLVFC